MKSDTGLTCEVRPAANHEARASGEALDMLVLHYTGMETAQAALERLCIAESGVSCHYLIDEAGRIHQMVAEERRAWHAGVSFWRGHRDVNSRSIGIEIANRGHEFDYPAFPPAQMDAVVALCSDILLRHAIPARNVVAHSDVAPQRKRDPGEKFDWAQLHAAGIGHWVTPEPITQGPVLKPGDESAEVAALKSRLAEYGYEVTEGEGYWPATRNVVAAFQRHFRPDLVDGQADLSTRATLDRLIEALG